MLKNAEMLASAHNPLDFRPTFHCITYNLYLGIVKMTMKINKEKYFFDLLLVFLILLVFSFRYINFVSQVLVVSLQR
jgi:hypothetical protein